MTAVPRCRRPGRHRRRRPRAAAAHRPRPRPPGWPRSPPGNTPPTWPTSPRSWPPNSTTAPPGAAPAASPKPRSRASSGWPTSTPTPSPASPPASSARLAVWRLPGQRRAGRAARRQRHRQDPPAHRPGPGRLRARPPGPLRHHRRPGQRARRSRRPAGAVPRGRPLRPPGPPAARRARLRPVDPRGAELLFQIITEREERASIAIGTNLPFSEWGTVFPDPRLVAAIVDRVTFNAHILETGTQSYRLRTRQGNRRASRAGGLQERAYCRSAAAV